jgi:hypothetical protein
MATAQGTKFFVLSK